jgi:hypothetical protein
LYEMYIGKNTPRMVSDDGSDRLTKAKAMSQKKGKLRLNWKGLRNFKLAKVQSSFPGAMPKRK